MSDKISNIKSHQKEREKRVQAQKRRVGFAVVLLILIVIWILFWGVVPILLDY